MRKLAIPAIVVILAVVVGSGRFSQQSKPELASTSPTASVELTPKRKVYPYSVVPGGVASSSEVVAQVQKDPVVASHYAPIRLGQLRPLVLERPKLAYVSYRKNDKIYWTARPVVLAAGEVVLSDGEQQIRGRCGNRISDVAQGPILATEEEPEALALDTAGEDSDVIDVVAEAEVRPLMSTQVADGASAPPPFTSAVASGSSSVVENPTGSAPPPVAVALGSGIPASVISPESVVPAIAAQPPTPGAIVTGNSLPDLVVIVPTTGDLPLGSTPWSPGPPSSPVPPTTPVIPPAGSVPTPTPPITTWIPPVDQPPVLLPPPGTDQTLKPPMDPPGLPPTPPDVPLVATPEPGTWVLMAAGVAVLVARRRWQAKR